MDELIPDEQMIAELNAGDSNRDQTLEYLVRRLRATKKTEEDIKAMRIICEEKIAALIPGPDRGQKTIKMADGTSVTVERGWLYKADGCAIEEAFAVAGLPHPPVKLKTTISLDEVGYEWTRNNSPEAWIVLNGLVIVTPKKVAVSIKNKK